MPDEKDRPRPHGDPLESRLPDNPEQIRAQSQIDSTAESIPRDAERDFRELSDRARSGGSSANGIPEFEEEAGEQRKRAVRRGRDDRQRDGLAR